MQHLKGAWLIVALCSLFTGGLAANFVPLPGSGSTELIGYTNILDVGDTDRALGSVTRTDYDAMTQSVPNFYGGIGTSRMGVATVAGRMALQVELVPNPGTTGLGSNRLQSGHHIAPRQEIWLVHSTFFPVGWDYGGSGQRQAMKVGPGIYGGVPADGGEPDPGGFSIRTMYKGLDGGSKAEWSVYKYSADQAGKYGDELKGSVVPDYNNGRPLIVREGVWQEHLIYVKVNVDTHTSDGILRQWIDGVLVYESTDILFMSEGVPQINDIRVGFFMGGTNTVAGHWAPDRVQVMSTTGWAFK